jgi:hypothetical protein
MTTLTPIAPPKYSQLEIHAAYSPAGFRTWSVVLRDLLYGARHLDKFYSKREAITAAERLARVQRIPFERGRRQKPAVRLAERTKFAAWQKRQQLVAQRAAKRAREESNCVELN